MTRRLDDETDGAPAADSAGIPWAGRRLDSHPRSDDDGSAPPRLLAVLDRFRDGEASVADVVDELRDSRLLVPLVAEVGQGAADKRAELSIVTVVGPDGRHVLPVFSSAEAMRHWNPAARPIPTDAVRVALAAVDDGTDLAVLDPTSSTEFAIRRPALWAVAQQRPWSPSFDDPEVRAEVESSIASETDVVAVELTPGDRTARLLAPELVVTLTVRPGLTEPALAAVLARIQQRWSASTVIADRVDSLAIHLTPAP